MKIDNPYSEWIGAAAPEHAIRVAGILNHVWPGLYNLPSSVFTKGIWNNPKSVYFCLSRTLATHDADHLTMLVILCHEKCIRMEISGASRGYLRFYFHRRVNRDGAIYENHPTIEQAIASVRKRPYLSFEDEEEVRLAQNAGGQAVFHA